MSVGPLAPHPTVIKILAAVAIIGLAVPSVINLALSAGSVNRIELSDPVPSETPTAELFTSVKDWDLTRGRGQPDGSVRVAIVEPSGEPAGDILFVHGHSDRLDNHEAVFGEWSEAGLRVIAFDLPQHGGTDAASLDTWEFDDYSRLLVEIERVTRVDRRRPLALGGFSFGAELVVHTTVEAELLAGFGRRPTALALFSPAIAVRPFSGGDGISRARSLVSPGGDPGAEPSPALPAANPAFATRLLVHGFADRRATFPAEIGLFVATGGETTDTYVDVPKIGQWAAGLADDDRLVLAVSCPEGRHAIDNEAWPLGTEVRELSTGFLASFIPAMEFGGYTSWPDDRCVSVASTYTAMSPSLTGETP